MKKINKLILIIIGVLSVVVFTGNVDAAELKFGSPSRESNNVVKVPVILKVDAGETVNSVKFECELNTLEDASCVIEKGNNIVNQGGIYNYSDEKYPEGETTVATLTLTNNTNSSLNTVPLNLKNAMIDSTSKTVSTTVTLGAKPVERTQSTNSKFSSVKFSKGTMSPNFSSDVTEYTVYGIADTINSVTISYECDNCSTTDIVGGKSISGNKIYLNDGENIVTIGCVNEAGTETTTYKFKIIRGETSYNSAKLKKLSFDGYTLSPEFDPDVKDYTLTIPNRTTNLVNAIEYETEDKEANIDVKGLDNYVVGENKLTITVDNVNGDETITYTVTVKRMSEEEIEITKYKNKQVTFKNSDGVETTLSESEFKTQYPDDYELITNGTVTFDDDGNRVFEVKAMDEETTEVEEKKSNKTIIIVIVIIVGIIIIGVAGFFIFRKKKPEDKNNKKDDNKKDKEETESTLEDELLGNDSKEETLEDEKVDDDTKEVVVKKEEKKEYTAEETMNIDEALSDLMSTKQYKFKDEDDK